MRFLVYTTLFLLLFGCKKDMEDGRDLSWKKIPYTTIDQNQSEFHGLGIADIEFIDDKIGYLSGTQTYHEPAVKIYKTIDGGSNWSRWNGTGIGCGAGSYGGRIIFTSASTGFVAYSCLGWKISKTADGGQSWNQEIINIDNENIGFELSINEIFLGSQKSTNGGQTWVPFNLPVQANEVSGYYLLDTLNGYFSTTTGLILETNDLGSTWDTLYNNSENNFSMITMVDSNTIIVGGNKIIISHDKGQSWNYAYVGGFVNDIKFLNSSIGFAGCTNGLILKTNDGGNTWSQNYDCNFMGINTLEVINEQTLIAAGSSRFILKTTTQGN